MLSQPLQTRTDEELMHILQAGSQDALSVLFERYYRLVLHTAAGIVRNHSEAEDVMQDVFLEIYRDAAKFDPKRGKLRTWLLQYAYHRSLNRRKYLATRGFYERTEAGGRAETCGPYYTRDGLTRNDWATTIHKGLRHLNPKERQAIELVCYEGLLLREIAENLCDSLPNVRNHYYRGLKKLRGYLDLPQPPRASPPVCVAPAVPAA